MRVFISWSGEVSKQLAQALRKWLPTTLQIVKPYFSPADIEKGAKWDIEISKELEASSVCVIALTRESLSSKWIMFEAGAISRSPVKPRVCAILFDLEPTDVEGPLERFQGTKFSKEEMFRLLTTMNSNAGDNRLEDAALTEVFEMRWPILETDVKRILDAARSTKSPELRDQRSLLEEAVSLARSISSEQVDLRFTLATILNFLSATRGVAPPENPLFPPNVVAALRGGAATYGGSMATYGIAGPMPVTGSIGVAAPGPTGSSSAAVTGEKPTKSILNE